MPIQGAALMRQEVRNKGAVWLKVDKKVGRDLWTLNPAHLWTQWPQSLSQRREWGEPRGNRCSGTGTPFRLSEKENQEQQAVLKSGPNDKRLCKTFAGCHVRGSSFVWPEDPGILSHKAPTQSGVHSWPHRFTEGQARSRTKQLQRQQRAKPLNFFFLCTRAPKTTSRKEN